MKAGVGYSGSENSARAGREAAERAFADSGQPALTILFTTDRYDQGAVLRAVQEVVGASTLIGSCMGGIITSDGVFEQGVGVCTLAGDEIACCTSLQSGLSSDPAGVGARAAREVLECGIEKGTVLVLPDGFGANISEMLRGLYNAMGPGFRYVGGGAGDNLKFFKTFQFTECGVESDALAVALLDGVVLETGIGHGWKPIGDPLVITRARKKRVIEIDGSPAFVTYCKRLGGEIPPERFSEVGMRHPFGFPDIAGNYLIRDPITVNPDNSIDFVTEIPGNAVGSLMEGDVDILIDTARQAVCSTIDRLDEPRFALLFDCISRYLLMGEDYKREIDIIKEALGPLPILGTLTFGEVGSYVDVPLFHNKTLTLAIGAQGLKT